MVFWKIYVRYSKNHAISSDCKTLVNRYFTSIMNGFTLSVIHLKALQDYFQRVLLLTQQYRQLRVLIMQKGHAHVNHRNFTSTSSSQLTVHWVWLKKASYRYRCHCWYPNFLLECCLCCAFGYENDRWVEMFISFCHRREVAILPSYHIMNCAEKIKFK